MEKGRPVELCESEQATTKDATAMLLDIMALCAHSGDGKSDLALDQQRYSSPSSSDRHHIIISHCVILLPDE
jgi:hypothetical protein